MKSERVKLLVMTILAYYAFFLFGFADNIKGPIIPALLVDLKLSYAGGSSLLLSAYIGFMAGVLGSGLIASRRNNRVALVVAGISLALGAAGNAFGASVLLLSATFFLLGFGLGCIEVGANGLIATLYPAESGRYLNLLAVFHGAGSMIAPLVAGVMIAGGTSWRGIYAIVIPLAALQALLLILFRRSGSPPPVVAVHKLDLSILLNRDLLLYSLFLIFYVAAEIGVASWMVDFLMKAKGFSVGGGSVMLSLYFGAVMAGRFIGSFLVERIGYRRILIWMTLASMMSLSAGILLSSTFALLVPLTGLFFSIMFPTATADAAGRTPWSQAAVFSILFFFAGLGGMLGPWLVGIGAELTGIQGGFLLNLLFCLLMLAALLFLKPESGRS